jgi:hypothetical protein
MEPDWNNDNADAISKDTLDLADLLIQYTELEGISTEIIALSSGCIELIFFITNNAELHVVINEKTHLIGFFNGNLEFEKQIKNSSVRDTARAIIGFYAFYSHIYV